MDTRRGSRLLASLAACAIVLVGCGAGRPAPAGAQADEGLAAVVDGWRRRGGYPSVSVAIERPGTSPWTHVSGTAALDGSGSVTPGTQLRIASITKMYVAAVVLQLVEEGRMDLDAPVTQVGEIDALLAGVTVRHLLTHTSGLPDYGVPELTQQLVNEPARRWNAGEVLGTLAERPPAFAPGTRHEYSNTNYVVIAEIIEATTGRSWVTELRERILDPLRLDATYVAGHERPRGEGLVAAAYFDLDEDGHVEDVEHGSWPALETTEGAAGAMISTAEDVARFTAALFAGRVVSRDLRAAMVKPGADARRYDDYGLGVELRHPDLQTLVWGHGGFLPGYRSVTWHVPSSGTTITVLVNHSLADPGDLAQLLLAELGTAQDDSRMAASTTRSTRTTPANSPM